MGAVTVVVDQWLRHKGSRFPVAVCDVVHDIFQDLYDLPPEEEKNLLLVSFSLEEALDALDNNREFLKVGNVFSDDLIDAYIDLKKENVTRLRMTTHPVEFDMYYSL